jgi:hypothetical protein
MKKLLLTLAVAIASLGAAQAQGYNWAVGVRLGGDSAGASVKYRMDSSRGLEFLASSYWGGGFMLTGLYERYIPVIDRGFSFYYGAGAHLGGHEEAFALGADGIIGLEYQFDAVPLALSFDWKPMLNIAEEFGFWGGDFALGVRITF